MKNKTQNLQGRFFYCYDKKLKNYLSKNGVRYNCEGLHTKTLKIYWQFDTSNDLQTLIDKYKDAVKEELDKND